ncbi:MAG: hypothetical protein KKF24_08910 [Gammaproteobacteria bacterium]|nr:hypothetical protein [Gammaproteobacteria bacterium]MBU1832800.1 hypothetical protein [Gammaproteobacteria bacterium]
MIQTQTQTQTQTQNQNQNQRSDHPMDGHEHTSAPGQDFSTRYESILNSDLLGPGT